MVYIIGIDHLVQYNGPLPAEILKQFREFLVSKARELDISLIAEEFNEEFLRDVYGATDDTAESAAKLAGIDHIYCDPDEREREMLGIPYYADVRDMVKGKYGITEKFIADNEVRKRVELETADEVRRYWGVRERFWYERIKRRSHENILFLCGHEHVAGFSELLKNEGVDVAVVDEFWMRDLFSDYGKLGLR